MVEIVLSPRSGGLLASLSGSPGTIAPPATPAALWQITDVPGGPLVSGSDVHLQGRHGFLWDSPEGLVTNAWLPPPPMKCIRVGMPNPTTLASGDTVAFSFRPGLWLGETSPGVFGVLKGEEAPPMALFKIGFTPFGPFQLRVPLTAVAPLSGTASYRAFVDIVSPAPVGGWGFRFDVSGGRIRPLDDLVIPEGSTRGEYSLRVDGNYSSNLDPDACGHLHYVQASPYYADPSDTSATVRSPIKIIPDNNPLLSLQLEKYTVTPRNDKEDINGTLQVLPPPKEEGASQGPVKAYLSARAYRTPGGRHPDKEYVKFFHYPLLREDPGAFSLDLEPIIGGDYVKFVLRFPKESNGFCVAIVAWTAGAINTATSVSVQVNP